jgi:choline dehydrogenase
LQDQTIISSLYLFNTPIDNSSNLNAPQSLAASFITLPQILGKSGADSYVRELNSTISERAAAIVASGAAVSQIGLEQIFTAQAKQFGEQDGTFLSLVWYKALLNDESVAPVVEILYGIFTEQIFGMSTWILLPQ